MIKLFFFYLRSDLAVLFRGRKRLSLTLIGILLPLTLTLITEECIYSYRETVLGRISDFGEGTVLLSSQEPVNAVKAIQKLEAEGVDYQYLKISEKDLYAERNGSYHGRNLKVLLHPSVLTGTFSSLVLPCESEEGSFLVHSNLSMEEDTLPIHSALSTEESTLPIHQALSMEESTFPVHSGLSTDPAQATSDNLQSDLDNTEHTDYINHIDDNKYIESYVECIVEKTTADLLFASMPQLHPSGSEKKETGLIPLLFGDKTVFLKIVGVTEDLPASVSENRRLNLACRNLFSPAGSGTGSDTLYTDRKLYILSDPGRVFSDPSDQSANAGWNYCIFRFSEADTAAGKNILESADFDNPYLQYDDRESLLQTAEEAISSVLFFCTLILVLLLFTGGLMIMNTMRFCVHERVKEIGIRRAAGASGRHIALQFLTEAGVTGLTGAFLSCLLTFVLSCVIRIPFYYIGYDSFFPSLHVGNILGLCLLSVFQTLLFTLSPAASAAALSPTEALLTQ